MKSRLILFTILVLGLFEISWAENTAEWIVLTDSAGTDAVSLHLSGQQAEFELPGFEVITRDFEGQSYQQIQLRGDMTTTSVVGQPELPIVTHLVAVGPEQPTVRVISAAYREIDNFRIIPVRAEGEEPAQNFHPLKYDFETLPVQVSPPMIMRDLRVAQVTVSPVQYDSQTNKIRVYSNIQFEIESGYQTPTDALVSNRPLSRAFDPLYASGIANYPEIREEVASGLGSYLIIVPDEAASLITPLVHWRQRCGYPVVITKKSQVPGGSSAVSIQNYIQDAYNNWPNPPEYIVLVGDEDASGAIGYVPDPGYNSYSGSYASDHKYARLAGSDYLADAIVGRISCDNSTELINYIQKLLAYEQATHMETTDWFTKASLISGNVWQTITTKWTNLWVMEQLQKHGYTEFDTIFDPFPYPITQSINSGVSIVNYRGTGWPQAWGAAEFEVYDVLNLSNGWQTPIVTSVVCGTGDYGSYIDPCFGEAWIRAGSTTQQKGGVAFFGATDSDTHTRWNNPLTIGFYWGLLEEGLDTFGQCMIRGKLMQYASFPNDIAPNGTVEKYHHTYNMLGDPALNIRTGVPRQMNVAYPENIGLGQTHVEIHVSNITGHPLANARVCLHKWNTTQTESEFFKLGFTDTQGNVILPLDPDRAGSIDVTVTQRDRIPFMGTLHVAESAYSLGVAELDVVDGLPNLIHPGQTTGLRLALHNYGSENISNVTAALSCLEPGAHLLTSEVTLAEIAANATVPAPSDFELVTGASWSDGQIIRFQIDLSDGDGHTWRSFYDLTVAAPHFVIQMHDYDNDGPNGIPDPGESVAMFFEIANHGGQGADDITLTLTCDSPLITLTQTSSDLGNLAVNASVINTADPVQFTVHSGAVAGTPVTLRVEFSYNQSLGQSLDYVIPIGNVSSASIVGPDSYGYYAYDNDDPEEFRQNYNWVEISPTEGGSGTMINPFYDDSITNIDLPFDFRYYGEVYDELSVCSNGWISFELSDIPMFRNWQIPHPIGTGSQVSVFWDDLDASWATANVSHWYDSDQHRFIIEWNKLPARWSTFYKETFQLILLDPEHNPTPTGDGELIFQFKEIYNLDYSESHATVGIESPDQTVGIQYHYAGIKHAAGMNLTNNLAIRFSTKPPIPEAIGVEDNPTTGQNRFVSHNYPNPFRGQTTIAFSLPRSSPVEISIYNMAGQRIWQQNLGLVAAGDHRLIWNGQTDEGDFSGNGVYFYRIHTDTQTAAKRMVIMR